MVPDVDQCDLVTGDLIYDIGERHGIRVTFETEHDDTLFVLLFPKSVRDWEIQGLVYSLHSNNAI